jgi:uncharacterized membrane protein YebE (DUF533 family)
MLIKLAALGALGYAGYRYFTSQQGTPQPAGAGDNLVAGGPLSSSATVQHSPDAPTFSGERPTL